MSQRSLWPREHGAYFQLALPLLAACARRAPSVAMVLLALAAAAAFVAHEPLRVVLGHRGSRRLAQARAGSRTMAGAPGRDWRSWCPPRSGAAPPSARRLRAIGLATVAAGAVAGLFAWSGAG
jgi:peptidoglycan/LPS O-acetylase OafA/YrhL